MDPNIKAQWVAALRSDEYTQGDGYLKTLDGNYCCLGVLCDLAVKQGVIPEPTQPTPATPYSGSWEFGNEDDTCDIALPKAVQEWAGLTGRSPEISNPQGPIPEINRYSAQLSELNDDGHTFTLIAQLIEKYL